MKARAILVLILIFSTFSSAISAKKKAKLDIINDTLITNIMQIDTFDINYFDQHQANNRLEFTRPDGTLVKQSKSEPKYVGFTGPISYTERIYPPKPKFYWVQKQYYANAKIQAKFILLDTLLIGITSYYNEDGSIKEEVNRDLEFGKFDYNKVLLLLEKKGHLNTKTGDGRERLSIAYDKEKNIWEVTINYKENYSKSRSYRIDGNSGRVLKEMKVVYEE